MTSSPPPPPADFGAEGSDPVVTDSRIVAIEAALRADEMHDVPLALMARVLEAVRAEPAATASPRALSRGARLARVAAAVVAAALGAHVALDGGSAVAAISRVSPPLLSVPAPLDLRGQALPELSLPSLDGLAGGAGDPTALLLAGAIAFVGGVGLAWRRARGSPS